MLKIEQYMPCLDSLIDILCNISALSKLGNWYWNNTFKSNSGTGLICYLPHYLLPPLTPPNTSPTTVYSFKKFIM